MATIDINDTTLYYERAGQGPAMLFVHGVCGDADVWADQAQRFSDRYTSPGGPRAAVDAFFSLLCPGLWSMLNETRKDRYRSNADIGFADMRSPSLDVDADDLAAVTIPALVLAGDTSHPSLRLVAHRLAEALPDARFVELDDCGHVTYAEQPDVFASTVSVFAAELDRRAATTAR